MKEAILLVATVGVIMTFGLICVNEACKTYVPAPTTAQYHANLDDLRELSMTGY